MQATERSVEKCINELHTLGMRGATIAARDAATQHAIEAIQAACSVHSALPNNEVGIFLSDTSVAG